jgi:excisionase family DNA binding protein
MTTSPKTLSVSQVAAICSVGRTTVGYWVRSKKLFAFKSGRSFSIPEEDLLHFLESSGQPIPLQLGNGGGRGPIFKSFRNCWTYWQGDGDRHQCDRWAVYKRKVPDCFSVRDNASSGCPIACRECRYFREMFALRFQFIHQLDFPAAVVKGLNLWSGNAGWAELCDVTVDDLIGLGIEAFIHPLSLATVISILKKAALGEKVGPMPSPIVIAASQQKERRVSAWVFPLRDLEGANLMLAEPAPAESSLRESSGSFGH